MGIIYDGNVVSIHAPAKGATKVLRKKVMIDGFQSTLPRRERLRLRLAYHLYRSSFNPRSREGSDINAMTSYTNAQVSIHAPAKGATEIRFPPYSSV